MLIYLIGIVLVCCFFLGLALLFETDWFSGYIFAPLFFGYFGLLLYFIIGSTFKYAEAELNKGVNLKNFIGILVIAYVIGFSFLLITGGFEAL